MTKGAKPGQNRFAESQKRRRDYRVTRIKEEVIPKLKAFAGKITFDGATPFSKFCAELYNDGLPVNEKKIGYRTLVQGTEYWAQLGPVYYKYWDSAGNMEFKKETMIGRLAVKRADQLGADIERLRKENDALRSALRNHGTSLTPPPDTKHVDNAFMSKFDKTCRALKLVLDASDGMFAVDLISHKIICAFNDLEPQEGLVPKELAEPFVAWLNAREKNHGQQ
ncbi:hypothetical protein E5170_14375 [Pseudomonas atacamensis]|uniref:Uncharacterized protein n=1 Tax=Pseudomonas atacamensis TaxID=2565368 RepID=A0AAQ2I0B5_9PSED|nr:hypothetical protein [Pseudomonas atacamensis]THF30385.1 hypothetical protein E5170_14375 [Pseudomonas atacamensis]